MTRAATAPGKLHLAGEYAVLDGAEAVMVAVDRRARATIADAAPEPRSPLLVALCEELRARFPDRPRGRWDRIVVDTTALYRDGVKLGLGSSAAATVAAAGLALADVAEHVPRDEVHAIARAAHAAAQGTRGARGSGADVAIAVHGGVLGVTPSPRARDLPIVRPLAIPDDLVLVMFWTGAPADTTTLVAAVTAAIGRPGVEAALTAIGDASEMLADAFDPAHGRAATAISAIAAGGDALAALARATGVALEPPALIAARRLATGAGGAAKTTGAGGGDVAIAALPATVDRARLETELAAAGCTPLALRIDPRGLDIERIACPPTGGTV